MAELLYRQFAEVEGVWFLDEVALNELDGILTQQLKQLKKQRDKDVQREIRLESRSIDQRFAPEDPRRESALAARKSEVRSASRNRLERIEIVIASPKRESVVCASFSEAAGSDLLRNTFPTEFHAKIQAGQNRVEISLKRRFQSDIATVAIQPRGDITGPALVELEDWAQRHRCNPSLCWWHKHWPLLIAFTFMACAFLCTYFVSEKNAPSDNFKAIEQANRLLSVGVGESNRDRAIETILQHISESRPAMVSSYSPYWIMATLVLTATAGMIIAMPPRTILAIGAGKSRLRLRKKWFSALVYSGPIAVTTALALGVAGSLASDYVRQMLFRTNDQQGKPVELEDISRP